MARELTLDPETGGSSGQKTAAPDKQLEINPVSTAAQRLEESVLRTGEITQADLIRAVQESFENTILFGTQTAERATAAQESRRHSDEHINQDLIAIDGKQKRKRDRDRGERWVPTALRLQLSAQVLETLEQAMSYAAEANSGSGLTASQTAMQNALREIQQALEGSGASKQLQAGSISIPDALKDALEPALLAKARDAGISEAEARERWQKIFEVVPAAQAPTAESTPPIVETRSIAAAALASGQIQSAADAARAKSFLERLDRAISAASAEEEALLQMGAGLTGLRPGEGALSAIERAIAEASRTDREVLLTYLADRKNAAELGRISGTERSLLELLLDIGAAPEELVERYLEEQALLREEALAIARLAEAGKVTDALARREFLEVELQGPLARHFELRLGQAKSAFGSEEAYAIARAVSTGQEVTREVELRQALKRVEDLGLEIGRLAAAETQPDARIAALRQEQDRIIGEASGRFDDRAEAEAVLRQAAVRAEQSVRADVASKTIYEIEYELTFLKESCGADREIKALQDRLARYSGAQLGSESVLSQNPQLATLIEVHRDQARREASRSAQHARNVWGSIRIEQGTGQDGEDFKQIFGRLSAQQFRAIERICREENRESLQSWIEDGIGIWSSDDRMSRDASWGKFSKKEEVFSRRLDVEQIGAALGPDTTQDSVTALTEKSEQAAILRDRLALQRAADGPLTSHQLLMITADSGPERFAVALQRFEQETGRTFVDDLAQRRSALIDSALELHTPEERAVALELLAGRAAENSTVDERRVRTIAGRVGALSADVRLQLAELELAHTIAANPPKTAEELQAQFAASAQLSAAKIDQISVRQGELLAEEKVSESAIAELERTRAQLARLRYGSAIETEPEVAAAIVERHQQIVYEARAAAVVQQVAELAYEDALHEHLHKYDTDKNRERREIQARQQAYLASQQQFISANQQLVERLSSAQAEGQRQGARRGSELYGVVATLYGQTKDRLGTGEEEFYAALKLVRSEEEMRLVRREYDRRFGLSLQATIRSEFSDAEEDLAENLLYMDQGAAHAAELEIEIDRFFGPRDNELERILTSSARLDDGERARMEEFYAGNYLSGHAARINHLRQHNGQKSIELKGVDDLLQNVLRGDSKHLALAAYHGREFELLAVKFHNGLGFFNDEEKAMGQVLEQVAGPGYTVDATRLAKFNAAMEKIYGGETTRSMVDDSIGGPERDWMIGILDGDRAAADAGKAEYAMRGGGTDEKLLFETAQRRAVLIQDLPTEITSIADPEERQQRMQEYALAQHAEHQAALAKRFEKNYGIALELRSTEDLEQDEQIVFTALRRGETLTEAHELRLAIIEGEEEQVLGLLRGRSKSEIEQLRNEYKEIFNRDLDEDVEDELGNENEFYAQQALKGEPETPQEMYERLKERVEFEESGFDFRYVVPVLFLTSDGPAQITDVSFLGGASKKEMQASARKFVELYEQGAASDPASGERLAALYQQATAQADAYHQQKEIAREIVKETATGAVVVVTTIATGGAGAGVWAIAGATAAAGLGTRMLVDTSFSGTDYLFSERMGADVVRSGIDGGTALIGIKASQWIRNLAPTQRIFAAAGAAAQREGIVVATKEGATLGMERVLLQSGKISAEAAKDATAKLLEKPFATMMAEIATTYGDDVARQVGHELVTVGERAIQRSLVARLAYGAADGAITGGVQSGAQGAVFTGIQFRTWSDGFGEGLGRVTRNGLSQTLYGAGAGAVFGALFSIRSREARLSQELSPAQEARALDGRDVNRRIFRRSIDKEGQLLLKARRDTHGSLRRGDVEDAILQSRSLSSRQVRGIERALDREGRQLQRAVAKRNNFVAEHGTEASLPRDLQHVDGWNKSWTLRRKNLRTQLTSGKPLTRLDGTVALGRDPNVFFRVDEPEADVALPAPARAEVKVAVPVKPVQETLVAETQPTDPVARSQKRVQELSARKEELRVELAQATDDLARARIRETYETVDAAFDKELRNLTELRVIAPRQSAQPVEPVAASEPILQPAATADGPQDLQSQISASAARRERIGQQLEQARAAGQHQRADELTDDLYREISRYNGLKHDLAASKLSGGSSKPEYVVHTEPVANVREQLGIDTPLPTATEAQLAADELKSKLLNLQKQIEAATVVGNRAQVEELESVFGSGLKRLHEINQLTRPASAPDVAIVTAAPAQSKPARFEMDLSPDFYRPTAADLELDAPLPSADNAAQAAQDLKRKLMQTQETISGYRTVGQHAKAEELTELFNGGMKRLYEIGRVQEGFVPESISVTPSARTVEPITAPEPLVATQDLELVNLQKELQAAQRLGLRDAAESAEQEIKELLAKRAASAPRAEPDAPSLPGDEGFGGGSGGDRSAPQRSTGRRTSSGSRSNRAAQRDPAVGRSIESGDLSVSGTRAHADQSGEMGFSEPRLGRVDGPESPYESPAFEAQPYETQVGLMDKDVVDGYVEDFAAYDPAAAVERELAAARRGRIEEPDLASNRRKQFRLQERQPRQELPEYEAPFTDRIESPTQRQRQEFEAPRAERRPEVETDTGLQSQPQRAEKPAARRRVEVLDRPEPDPWLTRELARAEKLARAEALAAVEAPVVASVEVPQLQPGAVVSTVNQQALRTQLNAQAAVQSLTVANVATSAREALSPYTAPGAKPWNQPAPAQQPHPEPVRNRPRRGTRFFDDDGDFDPTTYKRREDPRRRGDELTESDADTRKLNGPGAGKRVFNRMEGHKLYRITVVQVDGDSKEVDRQLIEDLDRGEAIFAQPKEQRKKADDLESEDDREV